MSPKPITASLAKALDATLSRLPDEKAGQARVSVSTRGVEAEVGVRRGAWIFSGYAARLWGENSWEAASRATVVW